MMSLSVHYFLHAVRYGMNLMATLPYLMLISDVTMTLSDVTMTSS